MRCKMNNPAQLIPEHDYFLQNWLRFDTEILGVKLDPDQQQIIQAIQTERRVSVRSGHGRGKDFVASVAAVTFLCLYVPSKVIIIAPTQRQVDHILMPEIAKLVKNARLPLGVEVLANRVKTQREDHYLLAFNTQDHRNEVWTGYHSPNIFVIVSEASGIEPAVFENIDGLLTGNSRLILLFNPHYANGDAYQSTRNTSYRSFHLNCLEAPNVKSGRLDYPGQVDRHWVIEMIQKNCKPIADPEDYQRTHENGTDIFKWDGICYLPNDIFRVRVMGEFPRTDTQQLIPLAWVEAACHLGNRGIERPPNIPLYLGVDVAGMGTDKTVLVHRYGNVVTWIQAFPQLDLMELAGMITNILAANPDSVAFIDTIGEGAGVYSRLLELGVNVVSVKFSAKAQDDNGDDLTDFTQQRKFCNLRAYCWWAIRDALDPQNNIKLVLPTHQDLIQDLTEPRWHIRSDGRFIIEEKSEIRKRLRRSTDFGDALALTYSPYVDNQPLASCCGCGITLRDPDPVWPYGDAWRASPRIQPKWPLF